MFWLNINFIFTWFRSSKYEIYIIYSAQLIKQIGVGHEIQTAIKKKNPDYGSPIFMNDINFYSTTRYSIFQL